MTIIEKVRARDGAWPLVKLALLLGVSRDKLSDMANRKTDPLPHFKFGTMYRFDPEKTADWLESRAI